MVFTSLRALRGSVDKACVGNWRFSHTVHRANIESEGGIIGRAEASVLNPIRRALPKWQACESFMMEERVCIYADTEDNKNYTIWSMINYVRLITSPPDPPREGLGERTRRLPDSQRQQVKLQVVLTAYISEKRS